MANPGKKEKLPIDGDNMNALQAFFKPRRCPMVVNCKMKMSPTTSRSFRQTKEGQS